MTPKKKNFEYPKKWSFGPEGTDEINLCMSIFGIMFFASLIISPIPGLLIGAISNKTGSDIKAGYLIFKMPIEQKSSFFVENDPEFCKNHPSFDNDMLHT